MTALERRNLPKPCTVCRAVHTNGGGACKNCRKFSAPCEGTRIGDVGQVVRCGNWTASLGRKCGECLGEAG